MNYELKMLLLSIFDRSLCVAPMEYGEHFLRPVPWVRRPVSTDGGDRTSSWNDGSNQPQAVVCRGLSNPIYRTFINHRWDGWCWKLDEIHWRCISHRLYMSFFNHPISAAPLWFIESDGWPPGYRHRCNTSSMNLQLELAQKALWRAAT